MSKAKKNDLYSGDLVEVKSADRIFRTLDSDGTLDGLPFMPEMLDFCGKRFPVSRRVEKTCVEAARGIYDIREFLNNDVVFLEKLRCSGTGHDGCQRICMVFWKTAWLEKVTENQPIGIEEDKPGEAGRAALKTMTEPGKYFCQSTELVRATRPLTRGRRLLKCFYDVRSGDVGPMKMAKLIFIPVWRKMRGNLFDPVEGPQKRTPLEKLDLRVGEIVQVKSVQEIAQTLDRNSRNRGLVYDRGLEKFSGRRYRVQERLDFMISEYTGEMKKPESTVILENLTCFCNNVLGGCPRQEVIYWRENWLTRVDDAAAETEKAVAP
jgi:predicted DNA-binding antitoxin AbrB/MazE fold protein